MQKAISDILVTPIFLSRPQYKRQVASYNYVNLVANLTIVR
jgi:hypothetical protein